MSTIFVVFPVHNRLQSTKIFLESLSKQSVNNYRTIICDDGSTDGTRDYLKSHWPNVEIIVGNGSLWWTAGINRCVSRALEICSPGDFILTINNDVLLPKDYLEQKICRAKEYPGAIIGSVCLFMEDRDQIETSGYITNSTACGSKSITKRGARISNESRKIVEVTHLPGKGVLIPCEIFQKIGIYDEKGLPQYHADTDFTLRAYKAGYKILVDFESKVYSDVNLNLMTLPSEYMTFRNIIKTFQGRYSPNNLKIYYYFARNNFPDCWIRFLVYQYIKIIGGLVVRYSRYKYGRIFHN